jgi:hypothetical protein
MFRTNPTTRKISELLAFKNYLQFQEKDNVQEQDIPKYTQYTQIDQHLAEHDAKIFALQGIHMTAFKIDPDDDNKTITIYNSKEFDLKQEKIPTLEDLEKIKAETLHRLGYVDNHIVLQSKILAYIGGGRKDHYPKLRSQIIDIGNHPGASIKGDWGNWEDV